MSSDGLTAGQIRVRRKILDADRPDDWEDIRCLCGSDGGILVSETDRHGLPYNKLLCPQCSLLRVSPRWRRERYDRFYRDEYRDLYMPTDSTKRDFFQTLVKSPAARSMADWLKDTAQKLGHGPSITVVEIGCGGGWNLANLPATWNRVGFDVDEDYLTIGRDAHLVMERGFIDEAIASGKVGQTDILLLSHVVEHFLDPVAELSKLAGAMRRDAVLLIEVPGIFRLHAKSRDPMRLMQNAHTFTFTAATLAAACAAAGLEVVTIDQEVRTICRPAGGAPAPQLPDQSLAKKISRYLKACEQGVAIAAALRRLPGVGRFAAAAFRRVWFPLVGWQLGLR